MITLSPEQCRVIGVLLEKEITTPDQYPLSLNGLTNGCNQKSSREPVIDLSESDTKNIIDQLNALHLVGEQAGFGSRLIKYKQRFCNTEFGNFQFSPQQLAVICVLLLRGPQTPGELRTRTSRLADFSNVGEVEATLDSLSNHSEGQIVQKLAKEPGKRDCRYVQLFSEFVASEPTNIPPKNDVEQRISNLEQQVTKLTAQVSQLMTLIDD